jgi:hypothetical protein
MNRSTPLPGQVKCGFETNSACPILDADGSSFVVPGHKAYMIKTLESWDISNKEAKDQLNYANGTAMCNAWKSHQFMDGASGCINAGSEKYRSYIRIYASRIY